MSGDHYIPPLLFNIPFSPDIRTFYFNWKFIRSLGFSYTKGQVHHTPHYQPFVNFNDFTPSLAAGSHYFQFNSEDHGFPLLGVHFVVNSSFSFTTPQVLTTPSSTRHCPVVHIFFREIPYNPPYSVLEQIIESPPLLDADISPLINALQQFTEDYHLPLEPPTVPLVQNK